MATLIVFISLLGFFLLYNTSKKAVLYRSSFIEKWAQDHPGSSKYSGLSLLVFGLVLSLIHFGVGSGIFAFFVILMTVASIVVLLAPLRYVSYKVVLSVLLLSIVVEVII